MLALELGEHHITVNSVAPGEIATEMTGMDESEAYQQYRPGNPLGAPGHVDEVASVIPQRFPRIDTTVLHLGGTTLPGGLMVTMDARQGVDLLELVSPSRGIPVHHSDYTVFKSPLSEFRDEVTRRGLHERVTYVEPGQVIDLTTGRDEAL